MFFSRMSRQTSSSSPEPATTANGEDESDPQSTSSPAQGRMSETSEGYPSWLPKRPPHPAPASSIGRSEAVPTPTPVGGRKATPRSIRVVSLQEPRHRDPTDMTRVPSNHRVWSRATRPTLSPTAVDPSIRPLRPKFRAPGLHLELLRDPSALSYLYFCFYPLFVFGHVLLQLFFDFNAVFIIFQVSKYPDPLAPGVPGSGRNWYLGAAAYIASTVVWILGVFIIYEIIYSFARRWRLKRPLMLPIYMSAPASKLASLTSYSRFCFLHHLRWSAFSHSTRQGLSETFYFYSQNLPTVALLLPRAGLSMALLFSFSSAKPTTLALAAAGNLARDGTFFKSQDGTLTAYARGVLVANAAWTGWRILVLLFSWVGLWALSGHSCGGLCGPRFRWEEEEANEKKRMSIYSTADSDVALEWNWKEETRARIQDAYEFCLTVKRPKSRSEKTPVGGGFEGIEKVMAAVGLGGEQAPVQVRRGVLNDDFFERGVAEVMREESSSPKDASANGNGNGNAKGDNKLLYPFTMTGAQVSSKDTVPFPPSPHPSGEKHSIHTGEGDEGEEDEEGEGEEEGEDGDEEYSSPGRTSGSMSSLGQPVNSRYPFQFRRPGGRSSLSSGMTQLSPSSRSTPSSNAVHSSSAGDQSSDSRGMSPMSASRFTTRSDVSSSVGTGIPMPPRRGRGTGAGTGGGTSAGGRARAGTVPVPFSAYDVPPPMLFPRGNRLSTRTRGDSTATEGLSSIWGMPDSSVDMSEALETDHDEGQELELEHEDILGLLSSSSPSSSGEHSPHHPPISPKSSLGALRQRAASFGRRGSRTNSQSSSSVSAGQRSRHGSVISSARSRAQSLIQSISQHSSVVDLTRIREHGSMSRLEEEYLSSSSQGHSHHPRHMRGHSRSESSDGAFLSGSEHNHTFGQPLPTATATITAATMRTQDAVSRVSEEEESAFSSASEGRASHESPERHSLAISATSEHTVSPHQAEAEPSPSSPSSPIAIPVSPTRARQTETHSPQDLSTAAQSFVTAPATIEGTTDSSSGRGGGSSWGAGVNLDRPETLMGGGPGMWRAV